MATSSFQIKDRTSKSSGFKLIAARVLRSAWTKVAAGAVLLIVLTVLGLRWYLLHSESAALPKLDGTIQAAGLAAPVSVVRDRHGVPHITAQTVEDLAFAQGYVTAQDRLWQMDMVRRLAAGELAEILGVKYVVHDKRQRYLQTRYTAESAAAHLDAGTRSALEAYARGVNAYMATTAEHLPLEFTLLRYKPRPWTTADTLLVGINMSQMLNESYPDDLRREKLSQRLSPELLNDLYPASFRRDHPPGAEAASPAVVKPQAKVVADSSGWLRRAGISPTEANESCAECRAGSNNWVISGAHSSTGKPLLSNDMHLAHSMPGVWYEAHLKLADGSLNVIGLTLPGVPFVIVGHNDRIAWGFTNLGPDVQDLYIENIGYGSYQTEKGNPPLQRRREVIQVAKAKSFSFDVDVTRHGPIISPALLGEARPIALKWTVYDPAAGLQFPFLEVDRARNWQEFTAAFSKFAGPAQNVVYADVDGHIGYHAAGRVPIRAAGDGTVPVSGSDGQHEWTGYVPFDKLPWSYDPQGGILATANNRVTPDKYPYLITTDWGSPYRVERIYQFLQAKPVLTPREMLALQTDVYSSADKFFADHFASAIDHTPGADARMKQAADLLRQWDGRLETDSAAARIEAIARKRLLDTIMTAQLGGDARLYTRWGTTAVLENIVTNQSARWLPREYTDWNALLADQVKAAISGAPADMKRWNYGVYNRLTIENPVIAAAPFLKKYAGPGSVTQSGSGTTVKQVGADFGPSERFTADLSDWDNSHLNIVTGQSGNFRSPYYMDQWDAWYHGTTFALPYTDAAVTRAKAHELTLVPSVKNDKR